MRELHYPSVPFDQDMNPAYRPAYDIHWYNPAIPPLLATDERKPADVEKTIVDVLSDLRGKAVSGGAAKQIRDAATERVRQVESENSFHRAIKGQS
jgi:hypothetical protein